MATIIKRFLNRARAIRPLRNEARDVFAAYADGANRETAIFLRAREFPAQRWLVRDSA